MPGYESIKVLLPGYEGISYLVRGYWCWDTRVLVSGVQEYSAGVR